jgi:flavodoxin
MTNGGEYLEGADRTWLDDLDRVREEVYLELAEFDVADRVVDFNPAGEHERSLWYIKNTYTELLRDQPDDFNWSEISADGRGVANTALISANMYRMEKDFQDSLIVDAITTRRIMEKINDQLEAEEEVDMNFFWQTLYNKKRCQTIFQIFYGKDLSDPWQKFYHSMTEQFRSIDYGNPDDALIYMQTQDGFWQFEEICSAHNMILREAAEKAGLFKIKDDPEMILRLVTILVETQLIAMRDRELGFWTDRIVEYGKQWGVGDRLIETLSTLYRERYLQD